MSTHSATRREQRDAISVLVFAAAGLLAATVHTVFRALEIFRDGGIYWTLPVDRTDISASVGFGADSIEGFAREVTVFATDVNWLSWAAIIGSLVVWQCAATLVIGAVIVIARNARRSQFFAASNVRAIGVASNALVGGAVLTMMCEHLAVNGVAQAIGVSGDVHFRPSMNWMPCAAAIAIGLIAHMVRRGIRLQQDTEGLV